MKFENYELQLKKILLKYYQNKITIRIDHKTNFRNAGLEFNKKTKSLILNFRKLILDS